MEKPTQPNEKQTGPLFSRTGQAIAWVRKVRDNEEAVEQLMDEYAKQVGHEYKIAQHYWDDPDFIYGVKYGLEIATLYLYRKVQANLKLD